MKKSQSIFLLSGLVPLVAAPIAIVASCSSDTATTTFSLKTNVTLTGLADDQKDPNQYAGAGADTKKKLADLIVAKKDQIFNNPSADLKAEQIQITNDVTANTNDGSLTFKLKVVSTATPPTDLIGETDVTLKGFTATQTPVTPTPLDEAVTKIEQAYDAKTFKLKDDKQTIPKSEIDALKTDPSNFLTNYTQGLPTDLGQGFTTKVTTDNFNVEDKPAGSKQAQQPTIKQQLFKFKVTVVDAQQKEKTTKEFSFEFTLQETTTKVQTTAKASVNATEFNLQGDKVSVAQQKLTKTWVVTNIAKLVNGDQEVTAEADVTALTVTPNAQDSTKLTLTFKLAAQKWYDNNGALGSAESADFSVEITGFTKAAQLTVKKQEFTTSELGQGFETKPFAELNQEMNRAAWLLNNREKYLNGDLVPGTTDKNFIQSGVRINFVQKTGDPAKADMTFSIAAGRSYDAQGRVTTTATPITFTVTNIRTN